MTRAEAIWHANHVFNLVIERCINAQNLKDAREFDEAKQIVIEALEQQTDEIVRCKDCKHRDKFGCHNPIWGDGWANYPSPSTKDTDFCSYGERSEE